MLKYKIIGSIRSDKLRDVLLWKVAEALLAKAINIYYSEYVATIWIKETNVDKELKGIKNKFVKTPKQNNQVRTIQPVK